MKSIIIEVNNLLIKTDADKLNSGVFTIEEGCDYLIEFINDNGSLHVSNAMNGYGQNCREDFAGKEVIIYHSQCNHEWVVVPDYSATGKQPWQTTNADTLPAKIVCNVCGTQPNPIKL